MTLFEHVRLEPAKTQRSEIVSLWLCCDVKYSCYPCGFVLRFINLQLLCVFHTQADDRCKITVQWLNANSNYFMKRLTGQLPGKNVSNIKDNFSQ